MMKKYTYKGDYWEYVCIMNKYIYTGDSWEYVCMMTNYIYTGDSWEYVYSGKFAFFIVSKPCLFVQCERRRLQAI